MIEALSKELLRYTNWYSLCLTLIILFGLYLLHKVYHYAALYSYVRWKLPGPKLDHPILGLKIKKFTAKTIKEWEDRFKEFPRFCRMVFGPLLSISITGPEVAQIVFNQADSKNQYFNYMMEPWLGKSLVLSHGAYWKRNRKLLTPTFHYKSLQNFVKIINKSSDRLTQIIHKNTNADNPIEFYPLISNMTLEVILNCICSKDSDLQLNIDSTCREMEYIEGLEKIKQGMGERFGGGLLNLFDIYYYRGEKGKGFLTGSRMTKQYILSLIRERRAETGKGEDNQSSNHDMLDLLLMSRDEEGNGLTEEEIIDELNTFVFAGHDTTGSASSFVFYLLSKHPELQDKCRAEVTSVMGEKSEVEWEDLGKLKYLTCFIKESIRLYSPVMFVSKTMKEPITIDGYMIPANVPLDIGVGVIHKNANHWPEPNKFDPTRFSEENMNKQHPYAFIPFSAGSRNCIGQNFAMSELKIIASTLIKNFQVSLQDGYEIDPTIKVVLAPSDNLPLIFKPLN